MANTQDVAGWEQPFTVRSQSCVVHGRLVAKAVWEPLHSFPCFGSLCVTTLFLEAHSFARRLTSYPTLPLFSEIPNLIPPSAIFEVKIWSLGALESNLAKGCYF